MSYLFRRYPPPNRRAVFYAREAALYANADEIDTIHLLCGLLVEPSARANQLFRLEERFPEETARIRALKAFPEPRTIPLSHESKRVLAYAEAEADRLDDYWIDTDHVALGILRECNCPAAALLDAAGLKIEEARRQVSASSDQRENYGAVPALWRLARPISRIGYVAGMWYVALIVLLIKLLTGRGC